MRQGWRTDPGLSSGGLVAGKTVKTTRTNQLMAFITLEDLLGTGGGHRVPRGFTGQPGTFFTEDTKLFIRGRVSIGDDPVGKLVCEQVIPFDSIPKELWLQFPDMETISPGEQRLLTPLRSSEGKGPVVIYLQKRGPESPSGQLECTGSRPGFGRAGGGLGEKMSKS